MKFIKKISKKISKQTLLISLLGFICFIDFSLYSMDKSIDKSRKSDKKSQSGKLDPLSEKAKKFMQLIDENKIDGLRAVLNVVVRSGQSIDEYVNLKWVCGVTPLMLAASKGHVEIIELLLQYTLDVNAVDKNRKTSLMYCFNRNENISAMLNLLISHGANVNMLDKEGLSALDYAFKKENLEALEIVLRAGANKIKDKKIAMPMLLNFIFEQNVELVQCLLNCDLNINEPDLCKDTALFFAAQLGSVDIVALLLAHGANVNLAVGKKSDYHTPLTIAAHKDHVAVLDALINSGADIEAKALKLSPFEWALMGGSYNAAKFLLKKGAKRFNINSQDVIDFFIKCANDNDIESMRVLIEYGINVTAKNKKYFNALHLASDCGNLEIVKLLVEKNQEQINNEKGPKDFRALNCAAQSGHKKVVDFLIANGANVNAKTTAGATALVNAAQNGHLNIVISLLKHHANPRIILGDYSLADGMLVECKFDIVEKLLQFGGKITKALFNSGKDLTPLFLRAAQIGKSEIVKQLLDLGISANATNDINIVPAIILATIGRHTETACLLFDYGADINIVENIDGANAFLIAVQEGLFDLVKLFLSRVENINYQRTDGMSALLIAVEKGYADIVKLLLDNGARCDIKENIQQNDALITASIWGNIDILKDLLACGADVNSRNTLGITPLIAAVFNSKNIELITLLLDCGADMSACTKRGASVFLAAVINGKTEIIKTILEYSLLRASEFGDKALVQDIINHSVIYGIDININMQTQFGLSPIKVAFENGYQEIVEYLISQGAREYVAEEKESSSDSEDLHSSLQEEPKEEAQEIASESTQELTPELELKSEKTEAKVTEIKDIAKKIGKKVKTRALPMASKDIENLALQLDYKPKKGRGKGSHSLFTKDGCAPIVIPHRKELKKGTLCSLLSQMGLSVSEAQDLMDEPLKKH